jgi:RimJ/RimL family protein N-acetyltransferase
MIRAGVARWWRRRGARRPKVALVDVDETVLDRMVRAALSDAAPDEVTAPMAGPGWGPERIEWLRRLHRDRRAGLDGPLGEATWGIVVDGHVVGAVRLKHLADPDALETGIWLTRSARGRGIARRAIAQVLDLARGHGARELHADTSAANRPAQQLLQRLGFRTTVQGDRVLAVRRLDQDPPAAARPARPGSVRPSTPSRARPDRRTW